jgi:hypothetical protein
MRNVDQYGYLGLAWRLQHRHGNEWVTLRERTLVQPDEEGLAWGGRVFVCPECTEEIRLVENEPQGATA